MNDYIKYKNYLRSKYKQNKLKSYSVHNFVNTNRLRALSICRYINGDWEINIPYTELQTLEKVKKETANGHPGTSTYCHRILIYNTKTQWGYHPYDYYENSSGPQIRYKDIVFPNELKKLLGISFPRFTKTRTIKVKSSKKPVKKKGKKVNKSVKVKKTVPKTFESHIIQKIEIVSKITNEFLRDFLENPNNDNFKGWKRKDLTFLLTGVERDKDGSYDVKKIGQEFWVKRILENNFIITSKFLQDFRHDFWDGLNKVKYSNLLDLINIATNKNRFENKIFIRIYLRKPFNKLKNFKKIKNNLISIKDKNKEILEKKETNNEIEINEDLIPIFENIDQVVIENNIKANKEFKINKKIEVDELVSMLDSKSETKQTLKKNIKEEVDIEEKETSNNETYIIYFLVQF
jgi:hypothetical protein